MVSQPASLRTRTASIAPIVVIPTVVSATVRFPDRWLSRSTAAMPHTAAAAFARIARENEFKPRISVTEGNITMSLMPTHGATLPEAIVETITFGNPYGSERITAVL